MWGEAERNGKTSKAGGFMSVAGASSSNVFGLKSKSLNLF